MDRSPRTGRSPPSVQPNAGLGLLGSVWLLALLGAAGKLLLASTWDRIAIPHYLVLGWLGLVMLKPLVASVTPATLALLGIGGLLFVPPILMAAKGV